MTQVAEPLEDARGAFARHEWASARDRFADIERSSTEIPLGDLRSYAEASWWTGQVELCERIQEQAYNRALAAGERDEVGADLRTVEVARSRVRNFCVRRSAMG